MKYYLRMSYDQIRELVSQNKELIFAHQELNEFVKNSLHITQSKAVEYINNLDEVCEYISKNDFDKNKPYAIIERKEKLKDYDEDEKLNVKIIDDNIILINEKEKNKDQSVVIPNQFDNLKNSHEPQDDNLKNCPHCKSKYFFEGGCKFITCQSAFCNNKKFFCHLCGTRLQASDKIIHFPQGIYANSCLKNHNK